RQHKGHIRLTDEAIGVILAAPVCGEVSTAEAELSGTPGQNRAGGQVENRVLCAFDEPFEALGFLTEADAEQRVFEGLGVLRWSGRLEPIPGFRAEAPVDAEVERTELVVR